jgi:hypothetical protein
VLGVVDITQFMYEFVLKIVECHACLPPFGSM